MEEIEFAWGWVMMRRMRRGAECFQEHNHRLGGLLIAWRYSTDIPGPGRRSFFALAYILEWRVCLGEWKRPMAGLWLGWIFCSAYLLLGIGYLAQTALLEGCIGRGFI